ncbi:hypothetical protein KVV02_002716 [Mortierella alpina]|uniref:Cation-transporting P-type ATPase N-terminal domain-containing protein n=1 Tax=Mortierella alpina TaxID=64518 RepID=A0A9P8D2G7_MORAP|nr:hypothetical protein KVV02_002716 [Mortierella alpina]
MAEKIEDAETHTKGKLEVEEAEHHEHKDEISPELEALLHTDPTHGLTTAEATARLERFGPNELAEVKRNPFLKFLGYFTGAIAYLIEVACIISAVVKDWLDFGIILGLLLVNACIGFIEESKAESALDALRQTLALKTRCWRDGHLVELDVAALVPGDVIVLRLGDIVPADGRLLGIGATGEATEGDLLIDQSALTGESLPVAKNKGKTVYSSSIVKQGQQMAVVTKTGGDTFIGRAANLISITTEEGHFQKIINRIGNFLILITVVLVLIIMIYQLVHFHGDADGKGEFLTVLRKVLVLTVAAIPVGLPTVMSVTMAVGAKQLAAKKVIVKRLTAVEEMASVSVLCSDKTGTLTLNELTFDEPYLTNNYTSDDILLYSYLAAEAGANDPIEFAVRTAAEEQLDILKGRTHKHEVPGFKVTSFLPFNPSTKLTQATITKLDTNSSFKVAKGAPQVIIRLVGGDDDAVRAVNSLAKRGLRALGVARTIEGDMDKWELIGMISLIDPPRPDSAETIRRCNDMGVSVKMITGDQLIIAKEVAHRLGMQRISARPDKWRIGQLITMSIVLGFCLCALSFAHFFIFWKVFDYAPVASDAPEDQRKLESIMYLHISSAPHFVIFSTRLTGYFWENLPSPIFAVVIIGTQIIALLMVIFGGLTPKVPAGEAIVVLCISFVYFILLDVVKVQLFKRWSFEMTATLVPTSVRRNKLAARKAAKIQQTRVWESINTVRRVAVMTAVVSALQEKKHQEPEVVASSSTSPAK